MSTNRESQTEREEEEEMVRRVEGGGRSLVQVVMRLRRGRAGRTPQNLDQTPNLSVQALQEVVPHGHEVERRPGGFQERGIRNRVIDNGPWTDDMYDNREILDRPRERCRIRWARARPSTPLPYPGFLIVVIPLLWGALWLLTDAPIVMTSQTTYFPCHPILRLTLTSDLS